jgi:hypothetical protein
MQTFSRRYGMYSLQEESWESCVTGMGGIAPVKTPVHGKAAGKGLGAGKAASWHLFLILPMLFLAVHPAQASDAAYRKSYIREIGNTGKYFMHLEGSPYEIGYAMGHFRPDEVVNLVHGEYVVSMFNFIQPSSDTVIGTDMGDRVDKFLRMPAVQRILDTMSRDVPYEYRLEMKGIVDGTNEALGVKAITYYHVLLVNFFPALQSLTTSEQVMKYLTLLFQDCNGYVAFGNATSDGRTIMGRHAMWAGDPQFMKSYVVEYLPCRGKRFVSIAPPGFVGVGTGLNIEGIGFGCDYFNAKGTPWYPGGMGMWFLGRKILQNASNIAEAEGIIRRSDEVAPSLLLVGDARHAGAVFEVYNHVVAPRYAGWTTSDPNAPDQIEAKEDLVSVTNNAFTPEMYPQDASTYSTAVRYKIITKLLLEHYGELDTSQDGPGGRKIIDFMHPPSIYLPGTEYDGYGDDPTQPVKQCVALMDLKTRTIWALYGHYNDEWVEFTLH